MPNTAPLPTQDASTPIADSLPQPSTGPVPTSTPDAGTDVAPQPVDQESPADWSPNIQAIANAHGDPAIWAKEFYELVGHVTGKWIDEQSLNEWLSSFAAQVQQATNRSAFFDISNSTVPANTTGDPAVQLLQFRTDLAAGFRVRAGL